MPIKHYQEHLFFYSKLSYSKQEAIGDEIFSDLGRYRGLLDVLASFDRQEYTVVEAEKFNEYLQKFNFSDNESNLLDINEKKLPKLSSILNFKICCFQDFPVS